MNVVFPHTKYLFLFFWIFCIIYIHLRGKVRLSFIRQLTDHSSFLAPINIFMYWFSKVPTTPYLNLNHFPELDILQKNWTIIRDEALNLYQMGSIAASNSYDDIGFNSFFRRGWKRFYLKWYQAEPLKSAQELCPNTVELLNKIPNLNAAAFTLLPKNSYLNPHRDPYAGSLRYHLGLVTPNSEKCSIYVDDIPYFWKDGEAVMFDETYLHHANNISDQDRIILFCDIQRPLKYKIFQYFSFFVNHTLMKASGSKNLPNEKSGVVNILFSHYYPIRIFFKSIKVKNARLYYTLKYIFFGGIFYWLFF